MNDEAPLLTLVQPIEAPGASASAQQAVGFLETLAPGLASLGVMQTARRGDPLRLSRSEPGVRLVTRGVLCLTHGESGLCTALVGEGAPAGPSSGRWLTDGAFTDIAFDALHERFGGPTALAVWRHAADLSRASVEAELVCLVRHAASRRLGRWILALVRDVDTTLITQTELARLAGLQRTSVCAAMSTLQARGALKVTRGRIDLRNRAALEREACRCGAPLHGPLGSAAVDSGGARAEAPADAPLRFAG